MSDADIRAWAEEQGIAVGVKGPLPKHVRELYAERLEDDGPEGDGEPMAAPILTAVPEPADEPLAAPTPIAPRKAETPPRGPRKTLFQRKPKPAGRPPRRVSIENVVSSAWTLGAMALARSPRALPMARVLDMQAPVAGVIVEDIAKGTIIDRILQPLARGGEKAEKAVALLGPPVIVGIMTAQPELFPVLRGPLKMTMMSWMQIAGPAMEKAQKRAEAFSEQFGNVDLDAMIDALWADLPQPVVVSEQEEENIRRARGE